MKLGFLYAGQGSQVPGMGKDIYEASPAARFAFEVKPLGLDLKQLCFEAEMDTLSRTSITQPCMGAFAAAVTRVLADHGIHPHMAAGLSLGEYGALHAAGVLEAEAMIELLAFRGRAMEAAAQGIDCGMTAVFGPGEQEINSVIGQVGGRVWCCNFNCPGQIVIGGEAAAVSAVAEKCLELGARRCIPLAVGGPFHTPMMEPAAIQLAARLKTEALKAPAIPVAFNVTGGAPGEGDAIPQLLTRQIMSPVRFERCINYLIELGAEGFVEIGPGKVLAGFVRKIAPTLRVWSVENADTLARTIAEIREESHP